MIPTMLSRRERAALNISSSDSIFGSDPSSSRKNITLFFNAPPCPSATTRISRYICCTSRLTMKYLLLSSSGSTTNTADFSRQNFSASILVEKHSICSSSESKNAFKLAIAVERTDAIACSPAVSAAPANHLALCSGGRRLKSICS